MRYGSLIWLEKTRSRFKLRLSRNRTGLIPSNIGLVTTSQYKHTQRYYALGYPYIYTKQFKKIMQHIKCKSPFPLQTSTE